MGWNSGRFHGFSENPEIKSQRKHSKTVLVNFQSFFFLDVSI